MSILTTRELNVRELGNVGWRKPWNPFAKNTSHYFINGDSLCGKYHIEFWVGDYQDSLKHCKKCEQIATRKILQK